MTNPGIGARVCSVHCLPFLFSYILSFPFPCLVIEHFLIPSLFLSLTCHTHPSIYYHYGLPTATLFPPSPPSCHLSSPCSAWLCVFIPFLTFIASLTFLSPDFQVTSPTKGVQLANGQTFPVTWTKGLLDGVNFFDLELTRMSTDGLILIARDSGSRVFLTLLLLSLTSSGFPPRTSIFIK